MANVLVVERGGACWGVEQCQVRTVSRRARGVALTLDGGRICADRVLGVACAVELRPLGHVLTSYWPVSALGLAIFEGHPVVMINPKALPACLAVAGEGDADEGGTR